MNTDGLKMKRRNNFWNKLFCSLERGVVVRVISKGTTYCFDGRIGIVQKSWENGYGVQWLILFSKKDNPDMTNQFDLLSFRRERLEVV